MACKLVRDWDWKSGDLKTEKLGSLTIPLNYFTCGTFYFDGLFYVVKFPAGMSIYHGSGSMAAKDIEFPVGNVFYNPVNSGEPLPDGFVEAVESGDKTVAATLSGYLPVTSGWFADPRIAKIQAARPPYDKVCKDKCVMAYTLKKDAVFILLDNNYNLMKFLTMPEIPEDVKAALTKMYSIAAERARVEKTDLGTVISLDKKRVFDKALTQAFNRWICRNIDQKAYAGYTANTQLSESTPVIHNEFILCNALDYMDRDLRNKIDWQYHSDATSDIMKQFMEQLSYYKTTNVNFSAGNLLENSIWALLHAESLITAPNAYIHLTRQQQQTIAALAFIHDLGKMDPDKTRKREKDCVYFRIPEHPKVGAEYIMGTRRMPLLDKNVNTAGYFDIDKLLTALGFDLADKKSIAKIVSLHMEFGRLLNEFNRGDESGAVNRFIAKVGERSLFFYFALLVVSAADIFASQPYIGKFDGDNKKSLFFPFITNRPKKYRGGELKPAIVKAQKRFADAIMKKRVGLAPDTVHMVTDLPPPTPPESEASRGFVLPFYEEVSDESSGPRLAEAELEDAEPVQQHTPIVPRRPLMHGAFEPPPTPPPPTPPPTVSPTEWFSDRIQTGIEISRKLDSVDIPQWKMCLSGTEMQFRNTAIGPTKVLGHGTFGQVVLTSIDGKTMVVKEALLTPEEKTKLTRHTRGGFPKNSWPNEFKMVQYVTELLHSKKTPNFLDTYHLAACEGCVFTTIGGRTEGACYNTFMEAANGDLKKYAGVLRSTDDYYSCLYQLLIAVHAAHHYYGLYHHDIKAHNIMVQETPQLKGMYFHYVVNGKNYYVKNMGYVFYLADFGVAEAYKENASITGGLGYRLAKVVRDSSGGLKLEPFTTKTMWFMAHGKFIERAPLETKWWVERDDPDQALFTATRYKSSTLNSFVIGRDSKPSIPVDLNNMRVFPAFQFYGDIQDVLRMLAGGERIQQPAMHLRMPHPNRTFNQSLAKYITKESKVWDHLWDVNRVEFVLAEEMLGKLYRGPVRAPENVIDKFIVS